MRSSLATLALIATLAVGAVAVAGCGGNGDSGAVAPKPTGAHANDAALLAGRRLYVSECQSCHGPAGLGLTGPRLAGVVTRSYPNIRNEINVVANGAGGAMPAWGSKLSGAQIEAIVRYTREVL